MRPADDELHPDAACDLASAEHEEGDAQADGVAAPLNPTSATGGGARSGLAVWDRRLTRGAKLRRVAVMALAVLLVLGVLFGGRLPALFAGVSQSLTARAPVAPTASIPAPTARALTAHPPVPLAASPWQQIGLPIPHDMLWSFAPVPSDPSTVYACVNTAHYKDNPTTLWRSRDAGDHWQQMPLLFGKDTACWVQVADDGMGHLSVLAESGAVDTFGNGCQISALYLSRDNGATWGALDPHAPFAHVEPNSLCVLTITPHHFYAYHYFSYSYTANSDAQFQALLMRSDDGRTWTRADAYIGANNYFDVQIVPERDDDVLLANVRHQNGDEYSTVLWRSEDAGKRWRTLGTVEAFATLMVSQEPFIMRSALASRMLYGVSGISGPEDLYLLKAIESSDGQQWERLSPLPVPGAAPDHVGVREVVGVAAGGKLLFLGVDPHAVVPTPGAGSDAVSGGEQWLWAWDPRAQRWEVPQAPLRAAKGSHCSDHCWNPHLSWGPSPDGAGYGTYVWVMQWSDTANGSEARLYRTFIPASQ